MWFLEDECDSDEKQRRETSVGWHFFILWDFGTQICLLNGNIKMKLVDEEEPAQVVSKPKGKDPKDVVFNWVVRGP
jgi:hypothetical protein